MQTSLPGAAQTPAPASSTSTSAQPSANEASSSGTIVRSALACLPCRQVKAKCSGTPPSQLLMDDGKMLVIPLETTTTTASSPAVASQGGTGEQGVSSIPAEVPCERCARLRKNCIWAPSHRTGRPRKKARVGGGTTTTQTQPGSTLTGSSVGVGGRIGVTPTPPATSITTPNDASFLSAASQDAGMGGNNNGMSGPTGLGTDMFGSGLSSGTPWSAFLQSFQDQPGAPSFDLSTSSVPTTSGPQFGLHSSTTSTLPIPAQPNSNSAQSMSPFDLNSLFTDPFSMPFPDVPASPFGVYDGTAPMQGQNTQGLPDASAFIASGPAPSSADLLLMDQILANLGMPSTAAPVAALQIPAVPTSTGMTPQQDPSVGVVQFQSQHQPQYLPQPQPQPETTVTESSVAMHQNTSQQRATPTGLSPLEQMLALRERIVGLPPRCHSSPSSSPRPSSSRSHPSEGGNVPDPPTPTEVASQQMPAVVWQGLRHYFGHGAGACAILGQASDFVQSVGRAFVVLRQQGDESDKTVPTGSGDTESLRASARVISAHATLFAAHASCAIGFRLAGKTDAARFGSAGMHTVEEAQRLGKKVEDELVGALGRIGRGENGASSGAAFLLRGRTWSPGYSTSSEMKGKRSRDTTEDDVENGFDVDRAGQSSGMNEGAVRGELDGSFLLLRALQGFLVMTLLHYGLGSPEEAARYLRRGIDVALRSGLHRLDSPQSSVLVGDRAATLALGERELEGWRIGTRLSEPRKEELRRVWWELYQTDLMLSLSTSNAIPRILASMPSGTAMHMPLDLGVEPSSGSKSGARETMDVRIRATALLHEATLPTARQLARSRWEEANNRDSNDADSGLQDGSMLRPTSAEYARAGALDLIAANLLVRAHNARANVTQRFDALLRREVVAEERRRVSGRTGKDGGGGRSCGAKDECLFMDVRPERDALRAASAEKESLFMAMLMLRAARIHLHRMLHFSDLNINFETCSLRPVRSSRPGTESQAARIMDGAEDVGQTLRRSGSLHAETELDAGRYSFADSEGIGERGDVDENDYNVDQKVGESVKVITTSANEIVHLVRSDYESVRRVNVTTTPASLLPYGNSTSNNVSHDIYPLDSSGSSACTGEVITHTCPSQVSPILRHGVFFGCSMVIAAYAYCVAIAGSAQAPDTLFTSPRPVDSEGVEVADPERDRQLWTKRLLLSNLGFAESVLEEGADVWPVQAKMKEEVNAARRMIDSFW
ncbi:hypothetical protein CF326_g4641 [Tilletia indica]|nr:hypothetical protein CF326_g4641 [Tilletia indica]